jgi:hypothetical protein
MPTARIFVVVFCSQAHYSSRVTARQSSPTQAQSARAWPVAAPKNQSQSKMALS